MKLDLKKAKSQFTLHEGERISIYDRVDSFSEDLNMQQGKYESRITSGDIMLVCQVNNKLAYRAWLSNRHLDIPKLNQGYQDDNCVYLYDAFTIPDYRGRGLHVRMSAKRVIIGFERFKTTSGCLLVEKSNVYARKSLRKHTWVKKGILNVIKIKNSELTFQRLYNDL